MRVTVLGAGVTGVATACFLARRGWEVTVMDRAPQVAAGTSHANGAQLSYSFTDALARPAFLRRLPAIVLGRERGMRLAATPGAAFPRWSAAFLRQCTPGKARDNTLSVLGLALRSAVLMDELLRSVPLDISFVRAGKMALLRGRSDVAAARRAVALKTGLGCDTEVLSMAEARRIEPALGGLRGEFAGVVWSANDHVADARAFTEQLAASLARAGNVRFRLNEEVASLSVAGRRLRAVVTDRGEYPADPAVVCLGTGSTALLRPLGIDAQILPVRGYSVTLPPGTAPPAVSISDLRHKIVFSNLGDRMRIAGFADLVGFNTRRDARRTADLVAAARGVLPDAARFETPQRQEWGGFRPMTPDGRPRVGPSGIAGLYLNTGHGMLGWTRALATAEKVARAVSAQAGTRRVTGAAVA